MNVTASIDTATLTALLERHIAETITQGPGDHVVIDCTCGAEVKGEMPAAPESTIGALMHVMAQHHASIIAAHLIPA